MEIWQNILNGDYTIRDFDDLSPEAESFTDSIMADWTGFYYDYSEFPELNMGEEVSGFIKVTKNEKLRIKLYLDDGDGIFSKEDDILLGKRKGNVDAKKRFAAHHEGSVAVEYYEETEFNREGEVVYENGFGFWMFNHREGVEHSESWGTWGRMDTELGTTLFTPYIHPCATQI